MDEKNLIIATAPTEGEQSTAVYGPAEPWFPVGNDWMVDPVHMDMVGELGSSRYYRAVAVEFMVRGIASGARRSGVVCAANGRAYTAAHIAGRCQLQTGDVKGAIDDLMHYGIVTQDDAGRYVVVDMRNAAGAAYTRKSREKAKARTAAADTQAQIDALFDQWYSMYPRHENKPAAKKAWGKVAKSGGLDLLDDIITATQVLLDRPASCLRPNDPRYIPLPSTYLNGARYEDAAED